MKNIKSVLVVLCVLVLCVTTASAAVRNVPSQYSTIQAAVNACAVGDTVQIAAGNYNQAVNIPNTKSKINIIGAGKTSTRIYQGAGYDALQINTSNVLVKNLTLENTAGVNGGQQQALFLGNNVKQISFNNCLIKGWQDTIDLKGGSQSYFNNTCEIWGSVDFIYDGGTAFFDGSTIRQIRTTGGTNAAPSTGASARGIIFWQCNVTYASGVPSKSSTLGRVWYAPGEVAYISCTIGPHITSAGWQSWNEGTTSRVAEYPCPSGRASFCKRLTSSSNYTKSVILGSWSPRL